MFLREVIDDVNICQNRAKQAKIENEMYEKDRIDDE
jgi:hypothetical protein